MIAISQHRTIGRVIRVDNFRVDIKIDEDLHGAYKSGVNDIYDVARINSYLIMPVGADRVVALITRVAMKEEIEFDKKSSNITLPTSARYILATMLGTITKEDDDGEKFIQGVYNFPALDNPVWYVTEKDLDHIFSNNKDKKDIEYEKDFYLPIGTSPIFSNYTVKICPDQFFVKHAAILGNTGSGKSCTFTSIVRNLFKHDYDGEKLKNAHIVIFDTNGEYKAAFLPDTKGDNNGLKQINAYYYGGDKQIQVPYWFMNWEDFKQLLKPSEKTQEPVLNRAIGLAKNEEESIRKNIIPPLLASGIRDIINPDTNALERNTGISDYGNWKYKNNNKCQNIGKAIKEFNGELGEAIVKLGSKENFNDASKQSPIIEKIKNLFDKYNQSLSRKQITSEANIDMPTWFSYRQLCTKFIDAAISQESYRNNKVYEYTSTLRLRMNSFLNDKRMAIPLMLDDSNEANQNILSHFIAFLLGDFNKYFGKKETNSFIKEYNDRFTKEYNDVISKDITTNQVTIVDVSQLPFEVLETVTALLGRLIIEFVSHFCPDQRGDYPIVIVLEEAQNYIAEEKESVAKKVFERIAREGRKYGVSLVVCSQRPAELSKTVLSQCNSFIIHRLQNPEDQKYIRGLVSSANADILNQLPIIPQQHAIITGDCVRTPIQVRIDDVSPTPNSNNPKYIEQWLKGKPIPYIETCERWLGIEDDKNKQS